MGASKLVEFPGAESLRHTCLAAQLAIDFGAFRGTHSIDASPKDIEEPFQYNPEEAHLTVYLPYTVHLHSMQDRKNSG